MTMGQRYNYFARLICAKDKQEFEYCYSKLVGNNCSHSWKTIHSLQVSKLEEIENESCPVILKPRSLMREVL